MATITSANAQLTIAVSGIFSSPQLIQGYAMDDAFMSEAVEQAEVQMGVDGQMAGGKVWVPYPMTIRIMASSSSLRMFETWRQQQDAFGDVMPASGAIVMPSIFMAYTLLNGYLTKASPYPGAKKVLDPAEYEITWQRIVSSPTGAISAALGSI